MASCMVPNNSVMYDDASVMWIDSEYIFQNLKMPQSTFQQILFSIPSKHRKMINDIGTSCPFPPGNNTVKYMVDIYGAAVLALRCPSLFSDQLLTTFIANNYMSYCSRQRPCPPPPPPPQPPFDCAQRQIMDALEKIGHQNDLLVNGINQISLNQSTQFLELSNALNTLKTQSAQILAAIEASKDALLLRLNTLFDEIKNALPDLTGQLDNLAKELIDAINGVSQTLRSELNNTNSILTNLASSITNINGTLNNLLVAVENIEGGLSPADSQKLNDVLELVTEIRSILMGVRK
nr:Calyx [Hyphantria cunea nucleopolyhedrovirus]UIX56299.1 Calyx [Hyphantria cunea nucleopolyhedrovirus]